MKRNGIQKCCRIGVAAIVAATLAACARQPLYVAPAAGDKAELIIRMRTGKDALFSLEVYDDAQSCKGRRKVLANESTGRNKATYIQANALITLKFNEIRGDSRCNMYGSFYPKANRSYVLDTSITAGSCLVRIVDITEPETLKPEPVINRVQEVSGCEPLTPEQVALLKAANAISGKPAADTINGLPTVK